MLLNNKKKALVVSCKLLVASCLLLGAQVVFAQTPFGDPTNTSGGTIQSGGGVRSGGATQSGGRVGAGGVINHTGGTIEAGHSINTKVCKQYAVQTVTQKGAGWTKENPVWVQTTVEDKSKCLVWDYNPNIEAGGLVGSKVCAVYAEINTWKEDPVTKKWIQKTVVDKNHCLAWDYASGIEAGGYIDTRVCVQYWQRTVFDEKPLGSGNFVPRTFEDKSSCLIWDYSPGITAGGNISAGTYTESRFFFPSLSTGAPRDLKSFIALLIDLIKIIIPIIGSLSLFVFFWGLAKFIKHSGSEKEE